MKVRISVTLPEDILKQLEAFSGQYKTRSELIETALRVFIAHLAQKEREARDIDIINRNADRLNQEAEDVLTYQVDL